MLWPEKYICDRTGLLPGASFEEIQNVQTQLGLEFPKEFIQFLLWADGGSIAGDKFVIYSSGKGIHPSETLVAANKCRESAFPLLLIGRDSQDELGFRKQDLLSDSCSIYFYLHEEESLDKVSDSFENFIESIYKKT